MWIHAPLRQPRKPSPHVAMAPGNLKQTEQQGNNSPRGKVQHQPPARRRLNRVLGPRPWLFIVGQCPLESQGCSGPFPGCLTFCGRLQPGPEQRGSSTAHRAGFPVAKSRPPRSMLPDGEGAQRRTAWSKQRLGSLTSPPRACRRAGRLLACKNTKKVASPHVAQPGNASHAGKLCGSAALHRRQAGHRNHCGAHHSPTVKGSAWAVRPRRRDRPTTQRLHPDAEGPSGSQLSSR